MPQLKWFNYLGVFFSSFILFFFFIGLRLIFYLFIFKFYLELILEGSAGTLLRSACNYMRA